MSPKTGPCDVDLQPLHTFHLPARAKGLCLIQTEADLRVYAGQVVNRGATLLLGEGSNTVFVESLPNVTVWKMAMKGRTYLGVNNDGAHCLRVMAGENWHELVEWTVSFGYFGLENLALIPGSVGSSPVQNIGAYGVELKDRISGVHFYDLKDQVFRYLNADDCQFAYRDSIFKQGLKERGVITAVDFALPVKWQAVLNYGDIESRVSAMGAITPQHVMQAIIQTRTEKLPDPNVLGNSGSFFKNPMVKANVLHKLLKTWPAMPHFKVSDGVYKLAAGWLIDQCGFKGKTIGGVGVYAKQALILVNHGLGTGSELQSLIELVQAQVMAQFQVRLEPEPNLIFNQLNNV